MELAFLVYFANMVESIKMASVFVLFGCFVVVFMPYMTDLTGEFVVKPWTVVCSIFAGLVLTFTPSERTVWLMAGAYGAQTVYESKSGQDLRKLIELKIGNLLQDEMTKQTKGMK